jgi:hypothetical protein
MMNIGCCKRIWSKSRTRAKSFREAVDCVNSGGPGAAGGSVAASGSSINWFVSPEVILMLFAYPKNEQDDLTPDQLKQLNKIVEEEYR